MSPGLHGLTWFIWAISASLAVQIAPNPLYVGLIVVICAFLVALHRTDRVLSRAFPVLVGLGVAFAVLRIALTVVTTHGSGGAVLATLPAVTLPRLLGGFTVGGTIESTVLAQAAADAIPIIGIMAAFGAFNAVVAHHQLLRSVPQAFHEPALIVTVAITLVPATMRAVHDARDADRARSGSARRRGRIRRTMLPVLETGMERAVALAESMDSRGFARRTASRAEHLASWATLASLLGLAGSFLALVAQEETVATVLGLSGAMTMVGAIVVTSKAGELSRYRPRRLDVADVAVMALSVTSPLALAVASATGDPTLHWVTSPLAAPALAVLPIGALCLLLSPALVSPALEPASAPARSVLA